MPRRGAAPSRPLECASPRPSAPGQPLKRSEAELDALVSAANRALAIADTAQGLHDLVDGVLVFGFAPVHVSVVAARAYVLAWTLAAEQGACRGRARVCRPDSTRGNLRYFEFLSGTFVGAFAALALCPWTAALVASKEGFDVLQGDFTYVATRVPRGLCTYLQIKLQPLGVDDTKAALLRERDALILERAQSHDELRPVHQEESTCR